MIYLDNAATTLKKPPAVARAMVRALQTCANPGRGGHEAAMRAQEVVYRTREAAAELFDCEPEQVCFTANATEGLNAAIGSLIGAEDSVLISGVEHNAVTRTLFGSGAEITIAAPEDRNDLFSKDAWIQAFELGLEKTVSAVICSHVSNVLGCVLPVEEIAGLCRRKEVPLLVDASQSAGVLPVSLRSWGAAFIAMPGHKGLYGPQGTGLLLCGMKPRVFRYGGTGSASAEQAMPDELPDRMEAGTLNVPGISGLGAGLAFVKQQGVYGIGEWERRLIRRAEEGLRDAGFDTITGPDQAGVLSFLDPGQDPEDTAAWFSRHGAALRAGLHCAPLAHQTAGTFPQGTVRLSVSGLTQPWEIDRFLELARRLKDTQKRSR